MTDVRAFLIWTFTSPATWVVLPLAAVFWFAMKFLTAVFVLAWVISMLVVWFGLELPDRRRERDQ